MIGPFDAPIPGQSLTKTPKNAPYETPPQITDPAEAIEKHLDNLSNPDAMEAAMELLESGDFTIKEIVNGLMRVAVASGIHSIDMSLLISPVVHEFIKQTADAVGVEYKEGFETMKPSEEEMNKRASVLARKQLSKMNVKIPEVSEEDIDEISEEDVEQVEAQTTKGLMSREMK